METAMRKLPTFLIALGAIVFAVVAPASAQLAGGLMFPGPGMPAAAGSCTPGTQATTVLGRLTGLSGTETTAYCNLVNNLVAHGLVTGTMNGANSGAGACGSLLDAIYIFVTNSTGSATINLCGTSYGLTLTGACTFTADSGYPCDGSTGFFKTSFIPSTATTPNYTLNSGFIGAWITTSRTVGAAKIEIGAADSGGHAAYLDPLDTTTFNYNLNANFGGAGSIANSDAKGAWLANRSSSSLVSLYKNGSSTAV
jgi:hypothetical protein